MANFVIKPTSSNDSIKFQGSDGSAQFTIAGTAGSLGTGITYPVGHVLQVQYAEYADVATTNQSYTSGNWADIPNLSISLTPSSATNYLLINGSVTGNNLTGSYAFAINLYVSGGGTDGSILLGNQTGSRTRVHVGGPVGGANHGHPTFAIGGRIRCNDTIPNWSSGPLTIKVQFATNDSASGREAIVNRSGNQGNNNQYTTTLSHFTVMEIQG